MQKKSTGGAAFHINSLPLRAVIKLQEPDLQSPYSPGEKSHRPTLPRPHRTTCEGNGSLMEVKPHVKENYLLRGNSTGLQESTS